MIANIEAFHRFPQTVRELVLCGVQGSLPTSNQLLVPLSTINLNNLPHLVGNVSNIKFVPSKVTPSTVCFKYF